MAEKKSRAKTVKAEVGRKAIPGAVLRAAVQAEIDRRARRDLAAASKPMQRVVREMPTVPDALPQGLMVVRPGDLDKVGLPAGLVAAIRKSMADTLSSKPDPIIRQDVTASDVERDMKESDGPTLLISSCDCGCPSINITIARPFIAPLRPGSEELVSVAQLPPEAIPDLVKVLIGMAEERGVRCR